MSKFSPLDLSPYRNATQDNTPPAPGMHPPWQPDLVGAFANLPAGPQTFWGIPFSLGPNEGGQSWLVLSLGHTRAEIPLETATTAPFIVFAHVCNSPAEVGIIPAIPELPILRPGEHLADYIFLFDDGHEHAQPIRRRFEINELMVYWGHLAFGARPHEQDSSLDDPALRSKCWKTSTSQASQAVGAGSSLLCSRVLLFYTGGFASPLVIRLLQAMRATEPALQFWHWGDLDEGGVRILAHLRQHVETIWPMAMDAPMFERHRSLARPLKKRERKNLLALR